MTRGTDNSLRSRGQTFPRRYTHTAYLLSTTVENFEGSYETAGHALHAVRLLLEADELHADSLTGAGTTFNLPKNDALQKTLLELALPAIVRHAERNPDELILGVGQSDGHNIVVEYGLDIVCLIDLDLVIQVARELQVNLPKLLSDIVRGNSISVRVAFQVEKIVRVLPGGRWAGSGGAVPGGGKGITVSGGARPASRAKAGGRRKKQLDAEESTEFKQLLADLVKDDEERFGPVPKSFGGRKEEAGGSPDEVELLAIADWGEDFTSHIGGDPDV